MTPTFGSDAVGSRFKKDQTGSKIRALSARHGHFGVIDRGTIGKPIEDLVLKVHKDTISAVEILNTHGRDATKTYENTDCLTEVMIPSAEQWLENKSIDLGGRLAGVLVGLKDTVDVARYNSSVGFSEFVADVKAEDGVTTKLLQDAGAVLYVDTNISITLLSFESSNDL